MNEKIRKLLESKNGEDQLIALSLIANTDNVDISFIPDNYDRSGGIKFEYLKNCTDLYGFIKIQDRVLLFGTDNFRMLNTEEQAFKLRTGFYKELDKNLQPLN